LRTGAGFLTSSCAASPFVFAADLVASLPDAFRVDGFVDGLGSVRSEVSSFLRLEDRGESSMSALGGDFGLQVNNWLVSVIENASWLWYEEMFRGRECPGQGASVPKSRRARIPLLERPCIMPRAVQPSFSITRTPSNITSDYPSTLPVKTCQMATVPSPMLPCVLQCRYHP
jgi:hypothetical protein